MTTIPCASDGSLYQEVELTHIALPTDMPLVLRSSGPTTQATILHDYAVIPPLLVQKKHDQHFLLLAQIPLFLAMQKRHQRKMLCRILPPNSDAQDKYTLQLLYEMANAVPNPVMLAYILKQASDHLCQQKVLQLLTITGSKPQEYKLQEFISMLAYPESVLQGIQQGILSKKSLKYVRRLADVEQTELMTFINEYHLSGSKQLKAVHMLSELHLREAKPLSTLIKEMKTAAEGTDNRPQEIQALLRALESMYLPRSKNIEHEFEKFVKNLQPPQEINVEHTPFFEDEEISVNIRFPTKDALLKNWSQLKAMVRQDM